MKLKLLLILLLVLLIAGLIGYKYFLSPEATKSTTDDRTYQTLPLNDPQPQVVSDTPEATVEAELDALKNVDLENVENSYSDNSLNDL